MSYTSGKHAGNGCVGVSVLARVHLRHGRGWRVPRCTRSRTQTASSNGVNGGLHAGRVRSRWHLSDVHRPASRVRARAPSLPVRNPVRPCLMLPRVTRCPRSHVRFLIASADPSLHCQPLLRRGARVPVQRRQRLALRRIRLRLALRTGRGHHLGRISFIPVSLCVFPPPCASAPPLCGLLPAIPLAADRGSVPGKCCCSPPLMRSP